MIDVSSHFTGTMQCSRIANLQVIEIEGARLWELRQVTQIGL
jgi:hypothetical protein